MPQQQNTMRSMAKNFQRDYVIIAVVPLTILLITGWIGLKYTERYLNVVITDAISDLNQDADHLTRGLAERFMTAKSQDVARQIEIYLEAHPQLSLDQLQSDMNFLEIALQPVGCNGYTAVYNGPDGKILIHPNPVLVDKELKSLAQELPEWWEIVKPALAGKQSSGYYRLKEAGGGTGKKFMSITPAAVKVDDQILLVAAAIYLDDFLASIQNLADHSNEIAQKYRQFAAHQALLINMIMLVVLLILFLCVYLLTHRAALRYIRPIEQLSEAVRQIQKNNGACSFSPKLLERIDEIGELARAFNEMSHHMQALVSDLEQRLEEVKQAHAAREESKNHYKTLYEESKRAEEVYRSLIHSSADAIVISDLAGNTRYVSPVFTEWFGWTLKELEGKPIVFVPESEKIETNAVMAALIKDGIACQSFATKRFTKQGRVIDISISASRFDDHRGKPSGILILMRDISEKRKLQAQLQHAERMEAIGTLAGGIAHDFNNLMMGMQGNVSVMLCGMKAEDPKYQKLKAIETMIESGSKLTRHLLGYARKGKYEAQPMNLNKLVQDTAETFGRTRKDITIHLQLSDQLNAVEADRTQIEQVLLNLYINAGDAMTDGGELLLKTQMINSDQFGPKTYLPKPGDYVLVTVADTGEGIDPQYITRIFDPFFTTKEMGRGTGLGLASVYGIVKAHGGYIDVTSKLGQGTTFHVYLPSTQTVVIEPAREQAQTVIGKGKILIVDDEAVVIEVCRDMLERAGYSVETAVNGQEAVACFREKSLEIDLVILDMVMPRMSGSEVFDQIKQIRPNAKVLLASGYSIEGKAAQILKRGCNGFIQKPFSLQQLSRKIEEIFSPKRLNE